MGFGFPPKYSESVDLNLRLDDAIELVKETFDDLHWNYSVEKSGFFSGWGNPQSGAGDRQSHRIRVKVDEYDGIEVTSTSLLPWPIFDGGSNKEVVGEFVQVLSMKSLDRPPRFADELPHGGRASDSIVTEEKL